MRRKCFKVWERRRYVDSDFIVDMRKSYRYVVTNHAELLGKWYRLRIFAVEWFNVKKNSRNIVAFVKAKSRSFFVFGKPFHLIQLILEISGTKSKVLFMQCTKLTAHWERVEEHYGFIGMNAQLLRRLSPLFLNWSWKPAVESGDVIWTWQVSIYDLKCATHETLLSSTIFFL